MFGFQWHLTDRCNRRCRHCYQTSHENDELEASANERIQAAAVILKALAPEPVTVNLTGGEPLLVPDLTDLMHCLESYENLEEINIITNGTIEDADLLTKVAACNHFKSFRISIESGDEKINDYIRGAGSLQLLCRTIPLYKALTGRAVTLMMTLSTLNAPTIRKTVDFAREAGADNILFERFIPLGTGTGMSEAVLTADDWCQAVRSIVAAADLEIDPDELAACRAFGMALGTEVKPDDRLEAALCNLGAESMALMPDGTVYPCRRLQIATGNVLKEPFSQIRSRLAKWECSLIRPRLRGVICGNCSYEDCPGCRAMAMAVTGDPLADDPQCILNRE